MRTNIKTHDRGTIPINLYAINLAASGSGKGYSTNIVEERVINRFKDHFLNYTFPSVSDKNLNKLAVYRAARIPNGDPDEVMLKVQKEFDDLGKLVFSFDSGTSPAVKQMRHKLLMAQAGAVNLEIDEIGSNLIGNVEVLNTFLELFDIGKVKTKLIKNTAENKRNEEIDGRTPTNMMLFGTPSKLLNPGSKVEDEFHSMLETGYARRCFFGFSKSVKTDLDITPEELYKLNTDTQTDQFIDTLSKKLGKLADEINFGLTLEMSKKVALIVTEYQLNCKRKAVTLPEHQEVRKAELQHRFYKALKLAGAYAFIDGDNEIREQHIYQAIKLTEESGQAFKALLRREKPHKALAKFIVTHEGELTVVDLMDNLPFFKGSEATRRDLLTRAIAYGHKNNMIIKRTYLDDIEFFTGEALEVTDLDKLRISYSQDITTGFIADTAPFDKLNTLLQAPGYHYTAHHYNGNYRSAANLIEGFNLVILDVDNGVQLETAKMLLSDFKAIFATTKRHTTQDHRFRVILPLSHTVKLDASNYSKFMVNVFNWLPFTVDEATKDCARKWESFGGIYETQNGKLLDALKFIPNTSEEEKQSKKILDNADLSNLERWFLLSVNIGNRNKRLIRYALALVDSGNDVESVRNILHSFNKKLKYPLPADEINSTVMVTVINKINNKQP